MKSLPLSLIFCVAPHVQAAATPPPSAAGYTICVDLYQAQQCSTEMYNEPGGYWNDMPRTPLRLEFPANEGNQYTAAHPHNNAHQQWPDIRVSYSPNADSGEAYVKVENKDFSTLVVLTFTDNESGRAYVYLHENGLTHHMRHVTFTMQKNAVSVEPISLPTLDECEGDPQLLDDGLSELLMELEERTYKSATEKLYQKRLLMLLPQIQVLHDPNWTTTETKGNTALHYACGLSHTELVQWLVNHGADTEAVTNKGATVDACIGGANAATIAKVLRQARAHVAPKETPEQAAAAAGKWLETAFACKDINAHSADIPPHDEEAAHAAQTLYRFVTTHRKHPFGVHVLSHMGRMMTWAINAKLSEKEFVNTVQHELYEARTYWKQLKSNNTK